MLIFLRRTCRDNSNQSRPLVNATSHMMTLLPQHGFVQPAILVFVSYGLRYLVFAAIAFFSVDPSRHPRIGYNSLERPANFSLPLNIRRELKQALLTLTAFTLIVAVLFGYGLIGSSRLYYQISDHPLWWFWVSIPVMILLHDTFFYWLHRAMHSRLLFELCHRPHHESLFPTSFTAYSFGWLEAFAEGISVVIIVFIIPVHLLAFMIFQTIAIAYNVYGHCGRDFLPPSARHHWLGRWFNTSSLHAHHHRYGHGNYSFYFTFWDRMMGTLRPAPHSL